MWVLHFYIEPFKDTHLFFHVLHLPSSKNCFRHCVNLHICKSVTQMKTNRFSSWFQCVTQNHGRRNLTCTQTRPQPNQKQPVLTWDWFDCGGEQCGEYEPRTKHVRQRTTMDCRVEVPHRARKGESQRQDTLWAWVPRERSQLVHSRAEPSVTVSHLNRLKSC